MVAELRASEAKFAQQNELVSQLQMELRRANVHIKELLDITNASTPSGSGTAGRSMQKAAAMPHETGMSWRQLALQVESTTVEYTEGVASSAPEAVLLLDGTELSMEEALRTAKRRVAQLRGELGGERDAKHSLEDELARRNRDYEQLKLELPALQEKFQELSSAEKASLDELAEAEERAISAEEEVLHRQRVLQILANEVDGIVAAADDDAARYNAEVVVSWDRIRRMHEAILSANLGPRQGRHQLADGGAQVPTEQLYHASGVHLQSAKTWPSRVSHLHQRAGATDSYGLTHIEGDAGFAEGRTTGLPLQQPHSAQVRSFGVATRPPWQPLRDISTPSSSGISALTGSSSRSRLGFELGLEPGNSTARPERLGAPSDVSGQRSTSAQAERFRARLEATASSFPKHPPSSDSVLTNRAAKPRPSIMEAMKAGAVTGASGEIDGENQSATLQSSSRPSFDTDDITLKAQAALQHAKAAVAGGSDETRSDAAAGAVPALVTKAGAENAREEAIRQRVREQLKLAQEEAAAAEA